MGNYLKHTTLSSVQSNTKSWVRIVSNQFAHHYCFLLRVIYHMFELVILVDSFAAMKSMDEIGKTGEAFSSYFFDATKKVEISLYYLTPWVFPQKRFVTL